MQGANELKENNHHLDKKRLPALWKKTLIRSAEAIASIIALFFVYTLSFLSGKPAIRVDYITQLNQMTKPQNQLFEENAWTHYKKAIELFVKPWTAEQNRIIYGEPKKKFAELGEAEQQAVEKWVEQNKPAWREFTMASSKPYCWREYKPSDRNEKLSWELNVPTLHVDMRHLIPLRCLSLLGLWHLQAKLKHGQTGEALRDCLVLIGAGKHWSDNKSAIESLLGLGLSLQGHREILRILSTNNIPTTNLKKLHQQLVEIYTNGYPTLNTEIEKLMFLDVVQHAFTEGGVGGGHLIPKIIGPIVQLVSVVITMRELETESNLKQRILYTIMSMIHARRNKTISKYNEIHRRMNKILNMTPYERRQANISIGIKQPHIFNYKIYFDSFLQESRYFLIGALMPAINRMSDVVYENRATHEAALTAIALELWRADTGQYPESLNELVDAGYLTGVPLDPYSNQPIIYRRTEQDFTFYSVGRNFKDDGGKVLFEKGGRTLQWGNEEDGDAVFRPFL